MEKLKVLLEKKQFKKIEKESTWYKELGKEMTAYFKHNCYWLPFRFEEWKLRQAFKECQNRKITKFNYCLGILKNQK